MTKREMWRRFYLATPCDCDRNAPARDRCNLSGWVRCNAMLRAWRAYLAGVKL